MYLSRERKLEIERSIDGILEPYSDVRYFTLEQVRDSLGIFKVGRSQAAIPGCHGQVFDVLGSYVILFEKDVEVTTKLVGHELGHVVLHLAEMSKLSRYSQWERRVMRSFLQDGRKRIGDTPQENAEADYFSEYWNRKLDGVDWLRGTVIEDLDDL